MLHSDLTRRQFLQTTTAAAGTLAMSFPLRADEADKTPDEKLRIAVIGCGGRGGGNLKSVSSQHIAALCDVNGQNLGRARTAVSERENDDGLPQTVRSCRRV